MFIKISQYFVIINNIYSILNIKLFPSAIISKIKLNRSLAKLASCFFDDALKSKREDVSILNVN